MGEIFNEHFSLVAERLTDVAKAYQVLDVLGEGHHQ
jgi:hypothetical protein